MTLILAVSGWLMSAGSGSALTRTARSALGFGQVLVARLQARPPQSASLMQPHSPLAKQAEPWPLAWQAPFLVGEHCAHLAPSPQTSLPPEAFWQSLSLLQASVQRCGEVPLSQTGALIVQSKLVMHSRTTRTVGWLGGGAGGVGRQVGRCAGFRVRLRQRGDRDLILHLARRGIRDAQHELGGHRRILGRQRTALGRACARANADAQQVVGGVVIDLVIAGRIGLADEAAAAAQPDRVADIAQPGRQLCSMTTLLAASSPTLRTVTVYSTLSPGRGEVPCGTVSVTSRIGFLLVIAVTSAPR